MIGSAPAVAVCCLTRGPYWLFRMRVRQWGRLPFRRGATLLVANHQHEDEAEILCERTFRQGPWRRPVFTASSRRMYEPGFFALRLPALRFARRWNATPMFLALGMLPIEHELAARPLASLAETLRALHGDLELEAAFRPPALEAVPGATRLSDLLRAEHFAGAQRNVKIALLRDPYRREVLDATRESIAADVARMRGILAEGVTFYLAPEGRYSIDGRLGPLRGLLDELAPHAEVRLLAIAFDPFRGRRLSMLYRIVPPADPGDLASSLAAARPVTASALLAERFAELGDAPFDAEALTEAVDAARRALPAGLFADPELRRPRRCVDEALATLLRRGTVVRDGARYRLGGERRDPRFPLVVDMLAYQRTFLGETRAAARRLAERGRVP